MWVAPECSFVLTICPFGFPWIHSFSHERAEWYIGTQGAYIWGPNSYSEWAAMPSVGARLAVDKQSHFCSGFSCSPLCWARNKQVLFQANCTTTPASPWRRPLFHQRSGARQLQNHRSPRRLSHPFPRRRQAPATGMQGTLGRNVLTGAELFQMDASVRRQ